MSLVEAHSVVKRRLARSVGWILSLGASASCAEIFGMDAPTRRDEADAAHDADSDGARDPKDGAAADATDSCREEAAIERRACDDGWRFRVCEGGVWSAFAACAGSGWRKLAAPSFDIESRTDPIVVAAGRWILVWGGRSLATGKLLANGARYDRIRETWAPLAPSPFSPRERMGSVWTGTAWLALGGRAPDPRFSDSWELYSDIGFYDPIQDRWHDFSATTPLGDRADLISGFDRASGRALFWGGMTGFNMRGSGGATYDVANGRWELLPELPISPNLEPAAAVAFGKVIVLGGIGCSFIQGKPQPCNPVTGAVYTIATSTWAEVHELPELLGEREGARTVPCGRSPRALFVIGGSEVAPSSDAGTDADAITAADGGTPPGAVKRDGVLFDVDRLTSTALPAPHASGRPLAGDAPVPFCVGETFGVVGGTGDGPVHAAPALYSASTSTWRSLHEGAMERRYGVASTVVGDDLFLFAGAPENPPESGGPFVIDGYAYRFEPKELSP